MFFVINKEKLFSFLIAVGMVGILLGVKDPLANKETIDTSTNIQNILNNEVEKQKIEKVE